MRVEKSFSHFSLPFDNDHEKTEIHPITSRFHLPNVGHKVFRTSRQTSYANSANVGSDFLFLRVPSTFIQYRNIINYSPLKPGTRGNSINAIVRTTEEYENVYFTVIRVLVGGKEYSRCRIRNAAHVTVNLVFIRNRRKPRTSEKGEKVSQRAAFVRLAPWFCTL